MATKHASPVRRRHGSLLRLGEFFGLYVLAPVVMAVFIPPGLLFPVLFGVTAVGIVLLHVTEGFHWHDLLRGMDALRLPLVLGFGALTAVIGGLVVWVLVPEQRFGLLDHSPALFLLIAVLYPLLSALPQEIVYRALFFGRYGAFLPSGRIGLILNAALFSLAHLMYWSWVVALMSFAGGIVFAWAYERRRSFVLAVVLHSLAGVILFALGLGVFFYSGNVVRPF